MDDSALVSVHRFQCDVLSAFLYLCRHFCSEPAERFLSLFAVIFDIDADSRVLTVLVVLFVCGEIDKVLECFQRVAVMPDQRRSAVAGDRNQGFSVAVVVNDDLSCDAEVGHQRFNEAARGLKRL